MSLCSAEMGLEAEEIAWVLYHSSGSKAADATQDDDRRVTYALLTARNAVEVKRGGRSASPESGTGDGRATA